MNIAVRYYSRSGNTKKLALAVAEAVGAEAMTTEHPLSEKADVLFLGSSVYAAGVDESVKKFIEDNRDRIGVIVNFSTAAILSSTYSKVKQIADENGVAMAEEEFHCRGSFGFIHKGKPDSGDVDGVKDFALKTLKKFEK